MRRRGKEEWTKKLTKATEALENYKRRDENSPEKKAVEKATDAIAHKDEAIESIIAQVFQLYSNLLMEEARRPWFMILWLEEQIYFYRWHKLFVFDQANK